MRTTIIHLDSDSKCQACISPPHVRLPTDFDSDRRVMALDVAIMIFFHNAQGRNMRHSRYDEQECRMTFVRDLDCREACSCTMSLLIWLCRFHKFLPHNSTAIGAYFLSLSSLTSLTIVSRVNSRKFPCVLHTWLLCHLCGSKFSGNPRVFTTQDTVFHRPDSCVD